MSDVFGTLDAVPATSRPDLLAEPVLAAIGAIPEALVAAIDPAAHVAPKIGQQRHDAAPW